MWRKLLRVGQPRVARSLRTIFTWEYCIASSISSWRRAGGPSTIGNTRLRGDLLIERPASAGEEDAMELRTRLNVLAAIISFAFLTAVVFGMF